VKYSSSLKTKFIEDNSKEIGKLFRVVKSFHENHPEKDLQSVADLELLFYVSYPATPEKDKVVFTELFQRR